MVGTRSDASGAARPQTRFTPARPDAPECTTIGGGTPDMTIGRVAADQAGARPYLYPCAGNAFQTCDAYLCLIQVSSHP